MDNNKTVINPSEDTRELLDGEKAQNPLPYEKPVIVTWSAEELESAGTNLNACVSYAF